MTDTTSTSATGALESQPAKKHTRGPCRQLKTAKVTRVTNSRINIGYDERHRAAPTADQHSSLAHDIGHVVRTYCPMKWKSWKAMPDEVRITVRSQLSTNYNLENLEDEMWAYINRLFAERHKQWKSDLHHHFQTYDDPQSTMIEKSRSVLQSPPPGFLPIRRSSPWILHMMQGFDIDGNLGSDSREAPGDI
ncbi:unnamed protein product, partial [Prunus brigantina]